MSRTPVWLLAGAAVCLSVAGIAQAQSPNPGAAVERGAHAHAKGQERAARLADLLQLRPDQTPALNAYLAAMRPDRGRMMKVRGERPDTTPERLAAMESRLAARETEARSRIAATRTFYAQLDARQKKAFDALPPMMKPALGQRHAHMMRMPHGHPGRPPAPPAPPRL